MIPIQARATHMRAAIIVAAAREFAECGYAGTSLSRIMKRIGGQPGHLYYYFPTKNSVGMAVIDQDSARRQQTVWQRRNDGYAGLEILAELIAQITHDLASGDPVARATVTLAGDPAARGGGIASPLGSWITSVSALVDEAIGTRQISSHVDPPEEAVSLVSAMLGLYTLRHDVAESVGTVYSMATRRCVAFFEAWGCERAVEVVETALGRVDAGGLRSADPVPAPLQGFPSSEPLGH